MYFLIGIDETFEDKELKFNECEEKKKCTCLYSEGNAIMKCSSDNESGKKWKKKKLEKTGHK